MCDGLRVAGYGLRAAGYGLRVAGYALPVAGMNYPRNLISGIRHPSSDLCLLSSVI
jgi:hypothetical protein